MSTWTAPEPPANLSKRQRRRWEKEAWKQEWSRRQASRPAYVPQPVNLVYDVAVPFLAGRMVGQAVTQYLQHPSAESQAAHVYQAMNPPMPPNNLG